MAIYSRCWLCENNCCEPKGCLECNAYCKEKNMCYCVIYDHDITGQCEIFRAKRRIKKNYIKSINFKKTLTLKR